MTMSWHKIWLVLKREFQFNFKRPSFLFTAIGLPLIMVVAMFAIVQLTSSRETDLSKFQTVGYIDRADIVAQDTIDDSEITYQPVTAPDLAPPASDADAEARAAYFDGLEAAATQQVIDGTLDAYFVVTDQYVLSGQIDLYTRRNVPQALYGEIDDFMRVQIAARAPSDLPVPQDRIREDPDIAIRDLDSNEELSEAALVGRFILPFVFVLVYVMATNTTAQFLMNGVVEEKENRLMEILATSMRPLELLWGKLLGLGALSLTQVALWLLAGLIVVQVNADAREAVSGVAFRVGDLALIAFMFLINFMLYAAIMLGIGAAVTAETESRQFAGIFTFVTVTPLMLLVTFFENPNGVLPMIFTFFPLTAATGLILRMSITTLPTWQILLSLGIQIASVLVVMWLAAKVFRLGMLMYGKPLTPRALWQALREGRVTLTTATDETPPQRTKTRKGWLRR
jgi:ABC-2 type transport system permease protein